MATVNIEIRDLVKDSKGNIDKKCSDKKRIRAVISDGKKKYRISSDHSIPNNKWLRSSQKVASSYDLSFSINEYLVEFKKKVFDAYLEAKESGEEITPAFIRELMYPKQKEKVKTTFYDVWDAYIDSKKNDCNKDTLKKLQSAFNKVCEFSYCQSLGDKCNVDSLKSFKNEGTRAEKQKRYNENALKIEVKFLDALWFDDFKSFCVNPNKANLNNQTANKYIEQVRTFVRWCVSRKLIDREVKEDIKETYKPLPVISNKKVILTESELIELRNLNIPESKKYLKNVRELFILSCFTGLRFSDYSAIKPAHLKDEEGIYTLEKMQQKTKDVVRIPLNKDALEVIKKLFNGTVKPISNQKVNKYLKELMLLMNFKETIQVNYQQGSEVLQEEVNKAELVSSHTGRRTFATLALLRGLPHKTVMRFTGHKDYKSFEKYVNIPEVKEEEMMRNVFNSISL